MDEKQEKVEIQNTQNLLYNNKYDKLKLCILLFNIFLLLDDINLHIKSITYQFYFFQLLIGEIIIFYLWIQLRKNKINFSRKKVIYMCQIHSITSIIYLLFQIITGQFFYIEIKKMMVIIILHQFIHIIFPISITIIIVLF
jgi:hypothetical protein